MTRHETEHLTVDWLDRVWLERSTWTERFASQSLSRSGSTSGDADSKPVDGPFCLGFVDKDPSWPADRLGPEPTWYLTEIAELRDEWTQHQGVKL